MQETFNEQHEYAGQELSSPESYDYSFVANPARIALYDDMKSAPRITVIDPAPTADFIEKLSSAVYEQSRLLGGKIPYTAIREVSENFIHAQFSEIIVSILDEGNTIRFADQGPGISHKEKAQLPGFSSAVEPMKRYIRGVGSGLPLVKEYLASSQGSITIEDNLVSGAVVTISLDQAPTSQANTPHALHTSNAPSATRSIPSHLIPPLSDRERNFIPYFFTEGALGVTDLVNLTGISQSSVYVTLQKMEQAGLIEKTAGKKRMLTNFGFQVANSLLS